MIQALDAVFGWKIEQLKIRNKILLWTMQTIISLRKVSLESSIEIKESIAGLICQMKK